MGRNSIHVVGVINTVDAIDTVEIMQIQPRNSAKQEHS